MKDNNYTSFFGGIVLIIIGVGAAYLFIKQSLIAAAICGIFVVVGIYMLATTKIVTIILDKATNRGTISLRGLMGSGTREMGLSKIKKVGLKKIVKVTHSSKGGSKTSYEYIVSFVMDTGEELPFELATVSASITDVLTSPDEKQKNAAKQIADFLGVQMEFTGPPSIKETLTAIKEGISEGIKRTDYP